MISYILGSDQPHPEQLPGENFIGNVRLNHPEDYEHRTDLRFGEIAYHTVTGEKLEGLVPAFAPAIQKAA